MTIEVGDHVSWTHITSRWTSLNMNTREGTVVAIDDEGMATIKPPSKHARLVKVHVRRLRLPGQRSQITEFVEAVVEANRVS